jgi:Zn-dependent protease
MLFAIINQLAIDPAAAITTFFTFVLALVVSISVHEFSHALVATRLGDPTPTMQGRLTLNPMAHLDPIGTLMILLAGFGWGKPVQVSPSRLRTDPRAGMAVVSLAGPLSNIIAASLIAIPFRLDVFPSFWVGFNRFNGNIDSLPAFVLGTTLFLNLILAVFNLIPVSPLDGFKVALGILPRNLANSFARTERYGPIILLLVILIDIAVPGLGIISRVIYPPVEFLRNIFIG